MINPEIKVVPFDVVDVITVSGDDNGGSQTPNFMGAACFSVT